MIYLVCNILFGSIFVLMLKWLQSREEIDTITVGCVNYIAGMAFVLPSLIAAPIPQGDWNAVLTGSSMGVCYFIAYFFVIYAIKYIGVAASTVVGVLSIVLPILAGVMIWDEQPTQLQVIGIVLALISLLLIGGAKTESGNQDPRVWFTPFLLISFFLLAGGSRLSQAAFEHVSTADQKPTYLFAAFLVSAIPSVACMIYRRKPIGIKEVGLGLVLGGSNVLQTFFLLRALGQLPKFQVFPIVSAGGLIFVTLVATAVFKEKLTRKSYAGIVFATVALVLLNLVVNSPMD